MDIAKLMTKILLVIVSISIIQASFTLSVCIRTTVTIMKFLELKLLILYIYCIRTA